MLPTPAIPRLVEQERLQRRRAPRGDLAQRLRRELLRERLDPEPLEALRQAGVVDQERLAEAARVGEPKLAAVVEQEAGAQVALGGRALALVQPPSPRRGRACSSPSTRTRLPVIRRCMTRVWPPSSASSRYLPRRPRPSIVRPADRGLQLGRAEPAATSARRAPPAARSAALPAPARAGGRRSRPRAARASPGSIRCVALLPA